MEEKKKPTPNEVNELRNQLGNAYASLDEYLKNDELTIEGIQLNTARQLLKVVGLAFKMMGNEEQIKD